MPYRLDDRSSATRNGLVEVAAKYKSQRRNTSARRTKQWISVSHTIHSVHPGDLVAKLTSALLGPKITVDHSFSQAPFMLSSHSLLSLHRRPIIESSTRNAGAACVRGTCEKHEHEHTRAAYPDQKVKSQSRLSRMQGKQGITAQK